MVAKKICGSLENKRMPMKFQKSYDEILREIEAQQAQRSANPWRRALERDLPANVTHISTIALLDLLGLAPTTGNARRIAPTMRSMGFIPLKSRRLMPGGNLGTTIRGWTKPFLLKKSTHMPKPNAGSDLGVIR